MYTVSPANQLVPEPPAAVFQVPSGAKVTTTSARACAVSPATCQPVACHGPVSHAGWLARASGVVAALFAAQATSERLPAMTTKVRSERLVMAFSLSFSCRPEPRAPTMGGDGTDPGQWDFRLRKDGRYSWPAEEPMATYALGEKTVLLRSGDDVAVAKAQLPAGT